MCVHPVSVTINAAFPFVKGLGSFLVLVREDDTSWYISYLAPPTTRIDNRSISFDTARDIDN